MKRWFVGLRILGAFGGRSQSFLGKPFGFAAGL